MSGETFKGKETIVRKPEQGVLSEETIRKAREILRSGGLVAFPTETVYGLGGDALNPLASERIYAAKGRPSDNPLIVHIGEREQVYLLAETVSPVAEALMEAFWPGPLTLVLPKKDVVPSATTGGLSTVALRMPANRVALQLLQETGIPIAAPSANLSGSPSPTTAGHVIKDLSGRIDMILDGGACELGLESTIVSLTGPVPELLRPGFVTPEMIREVTGELIIDPAVEAIARGALGVLDTAAPPKAPGMKYRHYAPKAPMTVFMGEEKNVKAALEKAVALRTSSRLVVICAKETRGGWADTDAVTLCLGERADSRGVARQLYGALRECDQLSATEIFCDSFGLEKDGNLGFAVLNRLMKACSGKVVYDQL